MSGFAFIRKVIDSRKQKLALRSNRSALANFSCNFIVRLLSSCKMLHCVRKVILYPPT